MAEQLAYDLVVRDQGSANASKVSKALKDVDAQADKLAAANSKLARSQVDVRQSMLTATRASDNLATARSKLERVTLDSSATDKQKMVATHAVEAAEIKHARALLGVQDATEAAARASRDVARATDDSGAAAGRAGGRFRGLSSVFSVFKRSSADIDAAGESMGRTERRSSSLRASLGLLSTTGRGIRASMGVAATGVTALGLAVVGVGVSAIALGVRTASGLEQAQIGFTTMLGSAKAARTFLGQLQKFAAATPFEFPELVSASQRLIAMGINAKNVVPYMRAIGDAVAGLGGGPELIDQVTTAIGQMSAKGKIQSDELLQLTEAGIPALKILASAYGVSTAKMQDMITKGKVLSDDALPKLIAGLETGTATTQGFGGMMAKQAQSMAGLWSTLKDTVSMSLANMITPAIPAIKRGLAGLTSLAATEGPKVTAWVTTTAIPNISQFVGYLNAHRGDIANFFVAALVGGLKFGAGVLRVASVVLIGVASIIQGFNSMESAILTATAGMLRGIGAAGSMLPGFRSKMNAAADSVEGYRDKANASAKAAVDQGMKMSTAAGRAADGMSKAARAAEGLRDRVRNIPGSHSTTVTAPGADSAAAKMSAAARAANGIPARKTTVVTVVASGVGSVQREINSITGHVVSIRVGTGPGARGAFAKGTPSAPPGLAWVGERGAELMSMSGGERVVPHAASVRMARAYATGSPGAVDAAAAVAGPGRHRSGAGRDLGTVTLAWPDGSKIATLLFAEERRGGPIKVTRS